MVALFRSKQRPASQLDVFLWAIVHDDIADCQIQPLIRFGQHVYGDRYSGRTLSLYLSLSLSWFTCPDKTIERYAEATGRDVRLLLYPF